MYILSKLIATNQSTIANVATATNGLPPFLIRYAYYVPNLSPGAYCLDDVEYSCLPPFEIYLGSQSVPSGLSISARTHMCSDRRFSPSWQSLSFPSTLSPPLSHYHRSFFLDSRRRHAVGVCTTWFLAPFFVSYLGLVEAGNHLISPAPTLSEYLHPRRSKRRLLLITFHLVTILCIWERFCESDTKSWASLDMARVRLYGSRET